MGFLEVAVLVGATLPSISAQPTIQFPINSQVPPVARPSQAFAFTFAESTFASNAGTLTYTLEEQPAWLQLDNLSRTFSGTPASDDVGMATFQLTASDAQGFVDLPVTLVVEQDIAIGLGAPVITQLETVGNTSAPATLFLYPLQELSLRFAPDIFTHTSPRSIYYATSGDNSPLPAWLQFDASSLQFSGTSPPLVSPTATPQIYAIRLVASDVAGFAEAVVLYEIVVGYHILAFSEPIQTISATKGQSFTSPAFRKQLNLDQNEVQAQDLVSVKSDAPSWLELDTNQISLNGTVPEDANSLNFTISVTDIHGDTTDAIVELEITGALINLFTAKIPDATATVGWKFKFTLSRSLFANNSITVAANLASASSWLSFDSETLVFEGTVPINASPGSVQVVVTATYEAETQSSNFTISILNAKPSSTAPSGASTITVTSSKTPVSTIPSIKNDEPGKQSKFFLLEIILPVVTTAILFICLLLLYFQRKRNQHCNSPPSETQEIAAAPATPNVVPSSSLSGPVISSASRDDVEGQLTPNGPPRIELSWAPDSLRKARERLSGRMSSRGSPALDIEWIEDLPPVESPSQRPRDRDLSKQALPRISKDLTPFVRTDTPNYSRKRKRLRASQGRARESRVSKRSSKAMSGIIMENVSGQMRMSGAGHGAGGGGLSDFNDIRNSWQDTEGSTTTVESQPLNSAMVASFPRPPSGLSGEGSVVSPERPLSPTLRMIPSSSSHSAPFAEQRQKWHIERARDQLERGPRFSHGLSSRPTSGARQLEGGTPRRQGLRDQILSRSWSRSSNVGPSPQVDKYPQGASDRPFSRVSSKLRRDLSTVSSRQFSSATSILGSQWEDDRLVEETDIAEQEGSRASGQATEVIGELTPSPFPLDSGTGWGEEISKATAQVKHNEHSLRLEAGPGKRPVSKGEVAFQMSERSETGSLAFV